MKKSIIDPETYSELSRIWKASPKTRHKTTPDALALMRLVTDDTYATLGDYLPYIRQIQIDLSDWITPVVQFPSISGNAIKFQAGALATINHKLVVAICGNKLINGEGRDTYILGILHHIYTHQFLYATYNQPIKLSKIRYSVTHISFGEYLRCNHPSMDNSERIIRAFFRQYKLLNAVDDLS